MKSTKYRKHSMSKYEYPTTLIKGSGKGSSGGISIGSEKARRALEQKLGRPLKAGTQVRTAKGNWRFLEPL